jgi:multiple sugar transport system permease protein
MRTSAATNGLRHLALSVGALAMVAPFAIAMSIATRSPDQVFAATSSLIPLDWSVIRNLEVALKASPLLRFLLNGAVNGVIILTCQVAVMVPCAYALAKLDFRGRDTLFVLVLLALVIPPPVLAIPHFLIVSRLGLIDTFAGLAFPWMVSAFGIFLMRQFFARVPTEIIEAARLDGLSETEILLQIMVPVALPAIGAFAIYSFVHHWNDLFWPSIVVKSETMATPPYGVMLFQSEDAGSDFGALMAGAMLVCVPMIVAFLIARRRFFSAMTLDISK